MSPEQHAEREYDLKYNSERYEHIWEGAPDDSAIGFKVLPYEKINACIDAHKVLKIQSNGLMFSGLDVAVKSGAVVSDFDGNPFKLQTDNCKTLYDVIASRNQRIHDLVLEKLASCK